MTKTAPTFRMIATPLDVPDDALDVINHALGVPTMMKPQAQPVPPQNAAPPAPAPSPTQQRPARTAAATNAATPRLDMDKLTIELPRYLTDAMKREAVERRTSVRHIVMLGLQKLGLDIRACDLIPDGRRTRG